MSENRVVRIFVSSTFRDFAAERDLLVRQVFSALRARLRDRFVELVDVDLRWGITAEQAERGEVLPICLAEIDRSRPYFVGLLGERYGWTPVPDAYPADLLERETWLHEHRGGKSVTELEILHGVMNNPAMAGRALFYFRAPGYAEARGGDYLPADERERGRQNALKASIRASGFPVVEDYPDPAALAERLHRDLWDILDATFPPEDVPDAFTRVFRQHEAYAQPRRKLYLGGERYIDALQGALRSADPRILIEGVSGSGKSTLLANWLSRWRASNPNDIVHEHYLTATSDAADPVGLVRRLLEAIQRFSGVYDPIANEPRKLFDSLPEWLATASAHVGRNSARFIIALDGLNGLTDLQDLRWLPEFLPAHIHLIASSLPGAVLDALDSKGPWWRIRVDPLTAADAEDLLVRYLARYKKTLSENQLRQALSHSLSTNPLFLRTFAEELRVFGSYEQLGPRIQYYLASDTVADLFGRMLARVEEDCGADQVRAAVTAIWASRAGLSEKEIEGFAGLVQATWAPIRHAMAEAFLEASGRLTFAHDYLRQAVAARYLPNENARSDAHRALALWFATQPVDGRVARELPWQWQRAEAWPELDQCLTTRSIFEAIQADEADGNRELMGYWLALERFVAPMEERYRAAWAEWEAAEKAQPEWETAERRLAWAKLAAELSAFLRYAGHYGELSGELIALALDIRETSLGGAHVDTGVALSSYATLLRQRGDDHGAVPYLRRALAILESVYGPAHADSIDCMRNLGAALRMSGDYAEAEKVLRRALDVTETDPRAQPDDGTLLNSLAVLIDARGDPQAAYVMMQRAADTARRVLGAESPRTLGLLRNLGVMVAELGDLHGAEKIYREVIATQERVLGAQHPDAINSLGRLAVLLGEMGEYERSEELFWYVLNRREHILGKGHPDLAATLNSFAGMLHGRTHYAVARQLLERSLKITQHVYGAEHPNTLTVMTNLSVMLDQTGDEAGAEQLERHVLAIRERILGPEHPRTAKTMANLALRLDKKGDHEGALALLRKAATIEERVLGPEHPSFSITMENLAGILRDQGDLDGALVLQQRVLAIREKTVGPANQATANRSKSLPTSIARKASTRALKNSCAARSRSTAKCMELSRRRSRIFSKSFLTRSSHRATMIRPRRCAARSWIST